MPTTKTKPRKTITTSSDKDPKDSLGTWFCLEHEMGYPINGDVLTWEDSSFTSDSQSWHHFLRIYCYVLLMKSCLQTGELLIFSTKLLFHRSYLMLAKMSYYGRLSQTGLLQELQERLVQSTRSLQ